MNDGARELEASCRDRPLVTPELHTPNDYYGHAALLKRYCGLPPERPLKVAIEHGIMINDYVWDVDRRTDMPLFLCASPAHAETYRRLAPRKRALAIGPLVRYAAAEAPPPARVVDKTMVVFPTHSTHRVRAEFDVDTFCSRIAEISRDFSNVVVCLYWKDVLDGRAAAYRARGFECVSAGHMFDFTFLRRLVGIIGCASLVYTNEVGSQVMYSVLLGKPVWIERRPIEYVASKDVLATDVPDFLTHSNTRRLVELFSGPRDAPSAEQREFIDVLCGSGSFRSPDELRSVLEEAEDAYRSTTPLTRRFVHVTQRLRWLASRRSRSGRLDTL